MLSNPKTWLGQIDIYLLLKGFFVPDKNSIKRPFIFLFTVTYYWAKIRNRLSITSVCPTYNDGVLLGYPMTDMRLIHPPVSPGTK